MKRYEQFLNNSNVKSYFDNDNKLHIDIISYDYNTLENEKKTNNLFERLKKYKKDIINHFKVNYFICQVSNYNINGLYESNSNLLTEDSILYCNF